MNQRAVFRNALGSVQSENGHSSAKNNLTLEQTPRKLPFGDKTNAKKAEQLLQSAVKEKNVIQISKTSPETKDENFVEISDFPKDKSCFCCGQDRLTDGEIWGRSLAMPQEIHEKLFDSLCEPVIFRPNSPLPVIDKVLKPIDENPYPVEEYSFSQPGMFDHELLEIDDDFEKFSLSPKKSTSIIDESDYESDLEVPEFEIDFSFDGKSNESNINPNNDSVFGDW